ncbi:MAG: Zn-ribbon domain-containing OB-fold protein [Actinomycetota bacterium]
MTHTLTELVAGTSPTIIEETRAFWEGTLRGELLVQVCNACGNVQLPGGPCCTRCWSQDLAWTKASGNGTVFSFTIVRHPFHPTFADKIPYVVADVQLEEGPVITSNVTGVEPDEVRIGMPVRVWFDEQTEDAFHVPLRLPKFRPE